MNCENAIFLENNELPISKMSLNRTKKVQIKLTHCVFIILYRNDMLDVFSHADDLCEIKIDNYRPCYSMSPLFTSEIRQPRTSEHPVSLGADVVFRSL